MRSSGTAPSTAVSLRDLRTILEGSGPFLSVYLGTDGSVETASARSEQRWKTLRSHLADEGAADPALALVDPLVADAHMQGAVLAVVATQSERLLTDHLGDPIDRDRALWGALPDLAPLVRWRQNQIPFVTALADRGGADLAAFGARPDQPEAQTVGEGEPARKVSPGGWSQPRFQQRAENDWRDTAGEVAAELAKLAEAVDARVVILGGDVRATHLIRDGLPGNLADRVHLIEHGRAADGSEDFRQKEIHRLVATAVAEDTVELLEKFKEELGQHDRAVEGADATVQALSRAAVDVLLVPDAVDDRHVWVARDPFRLSFDRGAVASDERQKARLIDALIAAAIATDASVRIVPSAGPVRGGIGALLRWSEP